MKIVTSIFLIVIGILVIIVPLIQDAFARPGLDRFTIFLMHFGTDVLGLVIIIFGFIIGRIRREK